MPRRWRSPNPSAPVGSPSAIALVFDVSPSGRLSNVGIHKKCAQVYPSLPGRQPYPRLHCELGWVWTQQHLCTIAGAFFLFRGLAFNHRVEERGPHESSTFRVRANRVPLAVAFFAMSVTDRGAVGVASAEKRPKRGYTRTLLRHMRHPPREGCQHEDIRRLPARQLVRAGTRRFG